MDPQFLVDFRKHMASMDIEALFKGFRFFTETLVILSEEDHPRLNGFSEFLKNTEEIKVINIAIKVIPLNNDEIMKAIEGMDTFIILTDKEDTSELHKIKKCAEKKDDKKSGFIFTYEAVDKAIEDPEKHGGELFYRINHGI